MGEMGRFERIVNRAKSETIPSQQVEATGDASRLMDTMTREQREERRKELEAERVRFTQLGDRHSADSGPLEQIEGQLRILDELDEQDGRDMLQNIRHAA